MAARAVGRSISCPRNRNSACRWGAGGAKPISVPIASSRMARMFAADSGIDVGTWINAGVSILIAFVIATVLDRTFRSSAARSVEERTGISREGATRLRFTRRLIYAVIILIGVAI